MKKIMFLIALVVIGGAILGQKTQNNSSIANKMDSAKESVVAIVNPFLKKKRIETRVESSSDYKQLATDMKVIVDLHYKVIRTAEESAKYQELLSSPENIDRAVRIMKSTDENHLAQNQAERMEAGLFLIRAMEFKKNPQRIALANVVRDLVLDSSVEGIQNRDLKRSVIADRIELYVSLKETNPKFAVTLEKQAATPLQKQMIEFATNFYELDKTGDLK